jgi:hypothetical protein
MSTTRQWLGALGLAALLSVAPLRAALGIGIEDVVDGGNTYPWTKVEIPGTICSDGSQYRFWYYDAPGSNNMVISFEGGGACWDYPTAAARPACSAPRTRTGSRPTTSTTSSRPTSRR